jgi:hypothetical protein
MPPPSRRSETPSVATRLLWSSIGFAVAVALTLCAARYYELPHFRGSAGRSLWFEPDFLFSLASSVVGVGVGAWSGRASTGVGATAAGSPVLRVLIWAGLTLLFLAVWVEYVFLFALLIAPAHALACLRLIGLWSRWRADRLWQRRD